MSVVKGAMQTGVKVAREALVKPAVDEFARAVEEGAAVTVSSPKPQSAQDLANIQAQQAQKAVEEQRKLKNIRLFFKQMQLQEQRMRDLAREKLQKKQEQEREEQKKNQVLQFKVIKREELKKQQAVQTKQRKVEIKNGKAF